MSLNEIGGGVYRNTGTGARPLRLADFSGGDLNAHYVKVVEDELIYFELEADGTATGCTADVMVDRGEFAAIADATWESDGAKFKSEMEKTRVNWWNTGSYLQAQENEPILVRTFIKFAGFAPPNHGEADMLYYTAHGNSYGTLKLHDVDGDGTCPTIMDGSDVSNNYDWNDDLEWFYSDNCLSLHNLALQGAISGRGGNGYAGWTNALFGTPRPAHMVLGHWHPVNDWNLWKGMGRSSAICDDFFDHAASSSPDTIVDSWLHANTDWWEDQECAIVAHADNVADKLKEPTRDTSSTSMKYYWYNPAGVGGTWNIVPFTKGPGGSLEDVEIPDMRPRVREVTLQLVRPVMRGRGLAVRRRRSLLSGMTVYYTDGTIGEDRREAEPSVKRVLADCFENLPSEIGQGSVGTISECDFVWGQFATTAKSRPIGHVYKWENIVEGLPVLGDQISVMLLRGRVVKLRHGWHTKAAELAEREAVNPKDLEPEVRRLMADHAKPFTHIVHVGLAYYCFHDAGRQTKRAVPVWGFEVANTSRQQNIFFNALTGACLDSRRDIAIARGLSP